MNLIMKENLVKKYQQMVSTLIDDLSAEEVAESIINSKHRHNIYRLLKEIRKSHEEEAFL